MYKRKIEINEIQGIELDILVRVINYFEKNNISYFTAGGTTLGSVRHGGFIPWDDDIDLFIPRKDYDRLHEISDGELIDGFISIKKPGDEGYIYAYSKACNENTVIREANIDRENSGIGVFIDLFPLDKHYNSHFLNSLLIYRMIFLTNLLEIAAGQVNLSKKGSAKYYVRCIMRAVFGRTVRRIGVEKLSAYMNRIGSRLETRKSKYLGNLYTKSMRRDYYPKEIFESCVKGEFEGHEINNPVGYDEYLTEAYGDYMKLPPKEEQIMHGFDAWYI